MFFKSSGKTVSLLPLIFSIGWLILPFEVFGVKKILWTFSPSFGSGTFSYYSFNLLIVSVISSTVSSTSLIPGMVSVEGISSLILSVKSSSGSLVVIMFTNGTFSLSTNSSVALLISSISSLVNGLELLRSMKIVIMVLKSVLSFACLTASNIASFNYPLLSLGMVYGVTLVKAIFSLVTVSRGVTKTL